MNIEDLFHGPGLVIDDMVLANQGDRITNIIKDIETQKKIPLVKYKEVPDIGAIHCSNLSFIIFDWDLVEISDDNGNPIPGANEAQEKAHMSVISLIDLILKTCYLPIFIFSNIDTTTISNMLIEHDIKIEAEHLPIFIESKSNIVDENGNVNLFSPIEEWIKTIPSVYILKMWSNAVDKARNDLFHTLSEYGNWPKVLWETYKEDSVDPGSEIMDVITKNVFSRMDSVILGEAFINYNAEECSRDRLLGILQAQRYTEKVTDESMTGDMYDLFVVKNGKEEHIGLFVNIRPSCDCVNRNGDDDNVYLIKGTELTSKTSRNYIYGNFIEHNNEAIVGPVYDKKILIFKFKKLEIKKYSEIKKYRKGRILPPFITHITERYGLYIQRQGLPRLPSAIWPVIENKSSSEEKPNLECCINSKS